MEMAPEIEAAHHSRPQDQSLPRYPCLQIAFPVRDDELRLVFSDPVDDLTAERTESYIAESGLEILSASVHEHDRRRVTLKTEKMPTCAGSSNDRQRIVTDKLWASGVETSAGPLRQADSPRFIQGIPPVREVQRPATARFPFTSRYVGLIASLIYNKDGGVDSNKLVNDLGFAFLHGDEAEPFDSIKVVTKKHVPGVTEAVAQAPTGQGVNILWAGGELRSVDGETRLVDTGWMEGSIGDPRFIKSPPPYPISTLEISRQAGETLRARSLQGLIVRFDDVTITSVSQPSETARTRSFTFRDSTGADASGLLLDSVTLPVEPGWLLQSLRGIVSVRHRGEYEVIVELPEHLQRSESR